MNKIKQKRELTPCINERTITVRRHGGTNDKMKNVYFFNDTGNSVSLRSCYVFRISAF